MDVAKNNTNNIHLVLIWIAYTITCLQSFLSWHIDGADAIIRYFSAIARKLSAGIPHVRVDLYNVDKHIFFGELTMYTGSGYIPFYPKEYDGKLGDLLTLPNASLGMNI